MNDRPPPASDGFCWVPRPCGPLLRCTALQALAPHAFSTRQLALRGPDAQTGWRTLASEVGVEADRLLRLNQVHGTTIVTVRDPAQSWSGGGCPEADAIVATTPDVAVAVRVADCAPILLADRQRRAVAAVHAGWRGLAAGIVDRVVRHLVARFGIRPDDLIAAVGPCIGPCCYEVGAEVQAAFERRHGAHSARAWFRSGSARRPHLDHWRVAGDELSAAGIADIHVAGLCTASHLQWFHSYRAEGPRTGRLAGVIRLMGVT